MVYLFSTILAAGVLTAICWPLFARVDDPRSAVLEETEWDLLQRKKDVILGNIQDLDFELKCGKLSAEDHQRIRNELMAEVAEVYRVIDRIEADGDLDALIRTAVAQRRGPVAAPCPGCGRRNPPSNKFCAECGHRLG